MMYKKILALSLFVFVLACLISLILYYVKIPKLAEELFGTADGELDFSQKLIYSTQLLMYQDQLITPGNANEKIGSIEIIKGDTAAIVSERLFSEGYIKNPNAFNIYLRYSGLDKRIRTGNFMIDAGKNSLEIAAQICNLTPGQVDFIILPGLRAEEIAELLSTSGLNISKQEFLDLVRNPAEIPLPNELRGVTNLEGYLFPGVYKFNRDITAHDFLSIILKRFVDTINAGIIDGFADNGMDLFQGVTLASIVQREGIIPEERPIIASVFINRFKQGMPLQSDPTIQYALGGNDSNWWKVPLTTADFSIESPFNTYLNAGLPPHPICSPDLDSITATAFPENTKYLYFQAACDKSGKHVFVETLQEQIKNLCD